ncbi:MAG: hypothetical protein KC435_14430 [Thermomicrobiales bacterium]|nr:hypothetical protein [Thermomicrobiales bacterium]
MANESTLDRHTTGLVFRAYTLELGPEGTSPFVISRPQLDSLFRNRPWPGMNIVISGPAGTGKSILALQNAIAEAGRIQYVTARGIPEKMLLQATPAWRGGELVSSLLNNLMRPIEADDIEATLAPLEGLLDLVITSATMIVIDDFDLLPRNNLSSLAERSSRLLRQLPDATVVIVTRDPPEVAAQALGARNALRLITSNHMVITPNELKQLSDVGAFAIASDDKINAAYESMGGWFEGIRHMLQAETLGTFMLDDYVLNDILTRESHDVQNIIFAMSRLPEFTHELVGYMLNSQGQDSAYTTTLFTHLPCLNSTQDPDAYYIPAPLRSSLDRLARIIGNQATIHELCRRAMQRHFDRSEYDKAKSIALTSNHVDQYLTNITPQCRSLALEERWREIRDLLVDIPTESLQQHEHLAFWYLMGLAYDANFRDLAHMRTVSVQQWEYSDDPMQRGRSLLMASWRYWSQSRPETTLALASEGFATLPASAWQERMMCAIQAENAARNLGDAAQITYWVQQNGEVRTSMALSREWWHINCGYHRLSYLAITGKMMHAREMARQSMSQTDPALPRARFRYPLLMAYIDIQRNDLDAARANLEYAQSCSNGKPTQWQIELAWGSYFLAKGELDLAREAIKAEDATGRSRSDIYFHRQRLLAEIEMKAGNGELAFDIITNWCAGDETWPKYFGEPNHFVVKARATAHLGALDDAIETAQYAINEATRRGHFAHAIAGYAVQAACYHHLGNQARRDLSIQRAIEIADGEPFEQVFFPFGEDVRLLLGRETPEAGERIVEKVDAPILTGREMELLEAAADGLSTREIADQLFISQSTVKNHMTSIFRKLGVNSRKEAIRLIFPRKQTR